MAAPNPTLRELNAPDLGQQNLAVTYPALGDGINFELKSSLLHRLPSFHGLSGEDPNKHLAKFFNVCVSMKPPNVTDDQVMMRAFPHSLKDEAEDWFYTLTEVPTWRDMKRLFLEKYFPAARLNKLKREIANVEQKYDESLYDYLERFKKLIAACPYHGYSQQNLVMYLYSGLTEEERRMVNAASGGNIQNKTPSEAFDLFHELAEGSRQFSQRSSKHVNAASTSREDSNLKREMDEIKRMVKKLMLNGGIQQVRACGLCAETTHPTDACPTLDDPPAAVNAMGDYQGHRPRYDPYAVNNPPN